MKNLATAIATIALIGTPAFAADIAVKAPPSPPPAPVYNWTGFYVGGNIGASFGTVKTDFNATPTTLAFTQLGNTRSFVTPGFAGFDEVYPGGFVGGGQIGYNWQFSPTWVVGLEADFQGADEKEHSGPFSSNFSGPIIFPGFGFLVAGTTVLDYATKLEWFGTVRPRLGYVFGDGTVMSYVTGGLAYGRVDLSGTSTVSGLVCFNPCPAPPTNPFSTAHAIGHSHVNTGWVVGTGTEGRLVNFPGWTYKIEGLYMDLGALDDTDIAIPTFTSATGGQTFTHARFTDTILRVGLNYQFH